MHSSALGRARRGKYGIRLLFAVALIGGCSKEAPPPKPAVVDVTAVAIEPQDAPVVYEFVGQTQSSREVEIRARVDGFLEKRAYTEGALVKEGQTLFLMDRKPFEAALQQARGRSRHSAATRTSRSYATITATRATLRFSMPSAASSRPSSSSPRRRASSTSR